MSWLGPMKYFELKLIVGTWGGFLKLCRWLDIRRWGEPWWGKREQRVVWRRMEKLMLKLDISLDGEEHLFYSVVCFMFFLFYPIWYGLILFLDHYKGHNCIHMCYTMHFLLSFTSNFCGYFYVNFVCL
jgi:hypothetical protein